jgi:aspartate racemase
MTNKWSKHIGIVACSAEGAALCYLTICTEGSAMMGEHAHPEVTMHTFPLSWYERYIDVGDWEAVGNLMARSAEKVAKAGSDFIICPDNTIHQAFDRAIKTSRLPWLHIAEVVATEAARQNFRRVGVLGTRYLMEGQVYATKLATHNIEHLKPTTDERKRINNIIFDELVNGHFSADSRIYFTKVINRLKSQGCDAVILGCTEIPLLVSQEDSSLPTLDSTRLLARAALRKAMTP